MHFVSVKKMVKSDEFDIAFNIYQLMRNEKIRWNEVNQQIQIIA